MFDLNLISNFILAGKILGVLLIMFSLYTKLFQNFGNFNKLLIKENENEKSLPYILIRGLIFIGLITLSTQLFEITDNAFSALEEEFISEYSESFYVTNLAEDPYDKNVEEKDISIWSIEYLLSMIMQYIKMITSGGVIFGYTVSIFLYMFDGIIYALFLVERFFVLGIIKLFAPLIIAFSIFEKYNNMIYDLGKAALRWYLVIIPFFIVNIFCGQIVKNMPDALSKIAGETGGEVLFRISTTLFYILIILIKFKLYKKSKEIMSEIIK